MGKKQNCRQENFMEGKILFIPMCRVRKDAQKFQTFKILIKGCVGIEGSYCSYVISTSIYHSIDE